MSLGNTFENDLLKLIFNGTSIANLADNAAAAPLASLYLSLHTADPGEAGSQTTSEAAYAGYARAAVARTAGGWTVAAAGATSLAANVDFPQATAGGEDETYMGIGTSNAGAGKLLMSGPISPTIHVQNGVIPRLTTATTVTLD